MNIERAHAADHAPHVCSTKTGTYGFEKPEFSNFHELAVKTNECLTGRDPSGWRALGCPNISRPVTASSNIVEIWEEQQLGFERD